MGCGGLLQLVALGVQDEKLTRKPVGFFFESSYVSYVNFALEEIENTFNGTVGFGRKVQVDIQRNGDLVWQMTLAVTLPELGQSDAVAVAAPGGVCWAPNIGHTLLKNAEIIVGGCEIDKHYGIWFDVYDELTLSAEHLRGYHRMIGQQEPQQQLSGQGIDDADGVSYKNGVGAVHYVMDGLQTPRNGPVGTPYATPLTIPGGVDPNTVNTVCHPQTTLHVPLRFWFNKNPGLALPLIALQFQQVRVQLEFRPRNECIALVPATAGGAAPVVDGTPELVNGVLWVNYVYLDNDARQMMATNPHEYLIKQLQYNQGEGVTTTTPRLQLNFNHPTTELVWFVQEDDAVSQAAVGPNAWHVGTILVDQGFYTWVPQEGGNQWNNYEISSYADYATTLSVGVSAIQGLHFNPMNTALLRMNGQDRFSTRSGEFFNEVQPYFYHTRVPESKGVFVYSFAINPEEHQPQGTANLSRIDTLTLNMSLKNIGADNGGVAHVFACNYNFFRVAGGMGGQAFAA